MPSTFFITTHGYFFIYIHLYLESPSNNQNTTVYYIKAAHIQYLCIQNPTCSPRCSLSKNCFLVEFFKIIGCWLLPPSNRTSASRLPTTPGTTLQRYFTTSLSDHQRSTQARSSTPLLFTHRLSLIARHESTNIHLTPGRHVGNVQWLTVK